MLLVVLLAVVLVAGGVCILMCVWQLVVCIWSVWLAGGESLMCWFGVAKPKYLHELTEQIGCTLYSKEYMPFAAS